MQLF
ncbi:hypothetical protein LINPERHAP2_LOCUS16682 [Linum perenne]|jgi:hypothetical protein